VKKKEILAELRNKSSQELFARREELRREQFLNKSALATGGEKREKLNNLRAAKQEIAQIMTVLRENEIEEVLKELLA